MEIVNAHVGDCVHNCVAVDANINATRLNAVNEPTIPNSKWAGRQELRLRAFLYDALEERATPTEHDIHAKLCPVGVVRPHVCEHGRGRFDGEAGAALGKA
jgi:hypothetical protein